MMQYFLRVSLTKSKHHKVQYLVLFLKTELENTNSHLEPPYGKPTILWGIQNLSTDYNSTITMKRVVLLQLKMTRRDVANYTQGFYRFFEWKQCDTVHFNLYKTMVKRERSRPADEPFMQWPAVHRPRSLELWVHLRLREKGTEKLKIRPWGFHSIHCKPCYL